MPCVVWAEEPKTDLGLEIRPWQQKLWRRPNVYLMGNPAVLSTVESYLSFIMYEKICTIKWALTAIFQLLSLLV